jgi:hypothetical protein
MHPDDDRLFDELRRAAEVHDPVPDRMVAAANAAYTFRTFEAELAALVFDSHAPEAGQLVRGTSAPRTLSFRSAAGGLELEVAREAGGLRLIGQLSPARAIDIELSTPEATTAITSDALGRFVARVSPPRPFLLRFESVMTGWVSP